MTVFVLLLITNLGPGFKFEKVDIVMVYASKERCEIGKEAAARRMDLQEYMRLECREQPFTP